MVAGIHAGDEVCDGGDSGFIGRGVAGHKQAWRGSLRHLWSSRSSFSGSGTCLEDHNDGGDMAGDDELRAPAASEVGGDGAPRGEGERIRWLIGVQLELTAGSRMCQRG